MSSEAGSEIAVEYDDLGHSTGVESEPQSESIHAPFDPAQIDVVTRTMTVDLLLSRLRRGVLDLAPDFQRHAGIWTPARQSRLIESLLLRIPLPTLYAAESDDETWAVVDGIQRLSTIARFVTPEVIDAEPLRLQNLEYLDAYEGATYAELRGNLQTRIDETELIVHLIRAGTPEEVKFNIFARINTGGQALTPQELRHALIPGRARNLLAELADSEAFRTATLDSVKPVRMADREMVLRFLAFRMTDPDHYRRGDLDIFLRDAMKRINALDGSEIKHLTADFVRAMWASHDIFNGHAFRKRFPGQENRLPVNKAIFEAVSVNLAALPDHTIALLEARRNSVLDQYSTLMANPNFQRVISASTGDVGHVHYRFRAVKELFQEAIR